MLRSQLNAIIEDACSIFNQHQICLPPFAYWSPGEWLSKGAEYEGIRACRLGWDVTDFGTGDFDSKGLLAFTGRNGKEGTHPYCEKKYAERLIVMRPGQSTPMHYHLHKHEDVISRNGGSLLVRVYNRSDDGTLADNDIEITLDGACRRVAAGHIFRLRPGESITLPPMLFHEFWVEEGGLPAVIQTISTLSDDDNDIKFFEPVMRRPRIIEDVEPRYLLAWEYAS